MIVPRRAGRVALWQVAVLVVLATFLGSLPGAAMAQGGSTPVPASSPGPAFVNISATSSFSFTPASFSVQPGQSVHLIVTQLADFNHTFTLSSVANFTLPSTDTSAEVAEFFNSHPPLVNLSLGSTVGVQFPVTFTAPATPGTYEFVCLIHFPVMTGTMTDSSTPSSSSSSGPSTTELVAIGVGIAVIVILGVVLVARRRRRHPPPEPPAQ